MPETLCLAEGFFGLGGGGLVLFWFFDFSFFGGGGGRLTRLFWEFFLTCVCMGLRDRESYVKS